MTGDKSELRIDLGAARDQGPRPTCLSFSISEIHRSAIGIDELLSPESLHRHAALRAGKHYSAGLSLADAIEGLIHDGQTTETAWPYNSETALDAGCIFHRVTGTVLAFDEAIVVTTLESRRPISLIIDIDMSFFLCKGPAPLDLVDHSQIEGRHAVTVCGFRMVSGNCEYLVKNSWGAGWGVQGHAYLTSKFVLARSPLLVRI